jgi:hypothetical protein
MRKYLPLFLFVFALSLVACRASKKNCDCPTFPTKKPRRRSDNGIKSINHWNREYPVYGIAVQLV